jgi:hypothetical protein
LTDFSYYCFFLKRGNIFGNIRQEFRLITGYNHNVRYKGQLFHVQTEESGQDNPIIVTTIFFTGNVITSKKSNYAANIADPNMIAMVRTMMQDQHKGMIKALLKGEFDHLESVKNILAKKEEKQEELVKSSVYQIYNPSKQEEKLDIQAEDEGEKSLDEMILDYLSHKKSD